MEGWFLHRFTSSGMLMGQPGVLFITSSNHTLRDGILCSLLLGCQTLLALVGNAKTRSCCVLYSRQPTVANARNKNPPLNETLNKTKKIALHGFTRKSVAVYLVRQARGGTFLSAVRDSLDVFYLVQFVSRQRLVSSTHMSCLCLLGNRK